MSPGPMPQRAAALQAQVARYSGPDVIAQPDVDPETRARLLALGYTAGSASPAGASRPDPKDRREEAARLAQVISGELEGAALERALRDILSADPQNPQANLRLGYVLLDSGRCRDAAPHFQSAIAAQPAVGGRPSRARGVRDRGAPVRCRRPTLRDAERVEPGNPVVMANLGLVLSDGGRPARRRRAAAARADARSRSASGALRARGRLRPRRAPRRGRRDGAGIVAAVAPRRRRSGLKSNG